MPDYDALIAKNCWPVLDRCDTWRSQNTSHHSFECYFVKIGVVYSKPAFGGPEQVIRYLGRYTHRVAISNHRLVSFDGDDVTFRWRDYATGNKMRTMTVSADEFIRRFLLHVLPKGFVRIRHFGVMANYHRSESIALCRKLLAMTPLTSTPPSRSAELGRPPNATWLCPRCHTPMIVIARLTAAQLFWMSSADRFANSS